MLNVSSDVPSLFSLLVCSSVFASPNFAPGKEACFAGASWIFQACFFILETFGEYEQFSISLNSRIFFLKKLFFSSPSLPSACLLLARSRRPTTSKHGTLPQSQRNDRLSMGVSKRILFEINNRCCLLPLSVVKVLFQKRCVLCYNVSTGRSTQLFYRASKRKCRSECSGGAGEHSHALVHPSGAHSQHIRIPELFCSIIRETFNKERYSC